MKSSAVSSSEAAHTPWTMTGAERSWDTLICRALTDGTRVPSTWTPRSSRGWYLPRQMKVTSGLSSHPFTPQASNAEYKVNTTVLRHWSAAPRTRASATLLRTSQGLGCSRSSRSNIPTPRLIRTGAFFPAPGGTRLVGPVESKWMTSTGVISMPSP